MKKTSVLTASGLCIFMTAMILIALGESGMADDAEAKEFARKREIMVKTQIESRGIKDKRVLDAMRRVERHLFTPPAYRDEAYNDTPLPIGEGQTISQPYIVALMTEVLQLDHSKKVLEIGTGSGYQAAILAEICKEVYTIEIFDTLGKRAEKTMRDIGYKNVFVRIGDGYQGWQEHSPFDAIIVTCAPTHVPEPLKDQLAEGGKMVIPVGESFTQELVLLTKKNGQLKHSRIIPVRFVPMIREDGSRY
jgi:protein-L-isoaspartate(D-aspartate) O-methyltransferase